MTSHFRLLALLAASAVATLTGCTSLSSVRTISSARAGERECTGLTTLVVQNNTQRSVALYEVAGRRQVFVAEVAPGGVLDVSAPKAESEYGARAGRGAGAWLALTSNQNLGEGGIQLIRGCKAESAGPSL